MYIKPTMRTAPFRANEQAASGRDKAIHSFTTRLKEPHERKAAATYIDHLIEEFGPVVQGYPCWHPFTFMPRENGRGILDPHSDPQGFKGLDHTIYFRHAFLTAPYHGAAVVTESAWNRGDQYIDAEEIEDVLLYNYGTTPVLVSCRDIPTETDGTISKRFALGSMLTTELQAWQNAQHGETWESMHRHILGTPCGSQSSLFVNQDTGKALRDVFDLLNHHELFGPVHSGK